jgi:hypothetical protein
VTLARGDYTVNKIKCVKGLTELTVESYEITKTRVVDANGADIGVNITIKLRVGGTTGANETYLFQYRRLKSRSTLFLWCST